MVNDLDKEAAGALSGPGGVPRRVNLIFSGGADTPAERMAAIRQLRKGQILNHLLKEGSASRVDISRALGFNLRTVSLLVCSLIDENIIIEKPVVASNNMGRRPVPLELNSRAASVLAIDARRHKTGMALLDLHGAVLVRSERASDFGDSPEEQGQWVTEAALDFLQQHHGDLPPLAGCGLSFEGFVFRQHVAHRHAASTEPIRLALENGLQTPVSSDTDSRLIAIAEQWFGEAKGARDAVILNISDGLGVGLIVDGKIMDGVNGLAGEIGHVPLGDPGIPCYCGSRGCLENVVSGAGLMRMAAHHGLVTNSDSPDVAHVLAMIENSNRGHQVMEKFISCLALAVILTDNLFDPGIIVLGGTVAPQIAPFYSRILEHLDKSGVPFLIEKTRIGFSTLGEDAVLLGAAGQILNHIYSASHVEAEALL